MQVTVDLVDWSWLLAVPGPEARVAALMDPPPGRTVSGLDLECWYSDSAVEFFEVGESLAAVAKEVGGGTAELIRTAFPLVLDYDMAGAPDDLGLPRGNYYYGSASPERVVAALAAASRLDLRWLAAEIEPPNPDDTERYLLQWLATFSAARDRSMGIVADYR